MDDREGFAKFYKACRPQVYPVLAVTLGDARLAQEAVDEALTRADERWGEVREMSRPAGWVYRVGMNWATSWRRKLSLRPTRSAASLDQEHHDLVPDVDLGIALTGLPMRQRQMLLMRFGLGYSIDETAAVLDVAPGTVKSGVHRACRQLRDDREAFDGHP